MEDVDTKLNLATKFKCHDVVIDVSPSEMRALSESSVGRGRLQRQGANVSLHSVQCGLARVSLETSSPIQFAQFSDWILSGFVNSLHSESS